VRESGWEKNVKDGTPGGGALPARPGGRVRCPCHFPDAVKGTGEGRYTPVMRRQGPITLRHLAIAVLVMVVVNAQLTWWIIFVIRQSGTVLELERRSLVDACRLEAERVRAAVEQAELAVDAMTRHRDGERSRARGSEPGLRGELGWTLPPFDRWAEPNELVGLPGWHAGPAGGAPIFEFPCPLGGGTCGLVVSLGWVEGVLGVGGDIEVVDIKAVGGSRPAEALPPPFDGLVVSPRTEPWNDLLADHRRRVVMMASEGAFFAVLLVVLVGILWRTVRREVELERQHRNFLSAITHEIKSPIAAIRLSLETVAAGRADHVATRRFVANALADTDRLERLVTKVLEATRYGAGTAAIHLEDRCLSDIVEAAVAAFGPRFTAAGATVSCDVEPDLWGRADREALTIAVSNLLENALKYGGRPPAVAVDLRRLDDQVVLDVRDNGAGISEADLPFVFDRFFRAGDEMTRTSQGTGLGLFLVQRIVTFHRGTVSVAATGDDGTTFRIALPAIGEGEDGA
jgi:signal transduction histidine kinase